MNETKIIVEVNPARGGMVEIYWYEQGTDPYYVTWDGVQFTYNSYAPGEEVKPFLRLQPHKAEELAKALSGLPNVEDATVSHLADAVAVRDRLLTLVEGAFTKEFS